MNNRKRQQNKVLRMYVRSAKKSNDLLIPSTFMDDLSKAIRAFGDAAVKCANTLNEWLNSGGVRELLNAVERYKEE